MKSDWQVVSYLRSDKIVNKFVKRPAAETQEKALAFIKRIRLSVDQGESFYWCITRKEDTEMIGSICLWNFSDDKKTAEIGYDLHSGFHKMGIMREALGAVLDFGINELKLTRIDAYTQRNNTASIRLLEKANFRLNRNKTDEDNSENIIFEIHSRQSPKNSIDTR